MKNACEGVMYPKDAAALVKERLAKGNHAESPQGGKTATGYIPNYIPNSYIKVPHKAWSLCKDELDRTFTGIQGRIPNRIVVLAPLHKGPITGEPFAVYTPTKSSLKGSDWEIQLQAPNEILNLDFIKQSDDVCTEEHSLEIIAPYLAVIYPNIPVAYLLAPENNSKLGEIKQIIGRMACDSLIFISDNEETHCASMWY